MSIWAPIFGARGVRVSGYTYDPVSHPAIDINPADSTNGYEANGANIYAPLGGHVTFWGQSPDSPGKDRGLHLTIKLDDGHTIDICHMAGVPWPDAPFYWERVEQGQHLGFLGHTGTTNPSGPGGAHVHLIVMDEAGQRIDPYPLLFEEEPVPEGYVLIKRTDLQNMRDVTNGWGQAAATDTGPYRLTVAKNRRQCSVELLDVVKAAEEALG